MGFWIFALLMSVSARADRPTTFPELQQKQIEALAGNYRFQSRARVALATVRVEDNDLEVWSQRGDREAQRIMAVPLELLGHSIVLTHSFSTRTDSFRFEKSQLIHEQVRESPFKRVWIESRLWSERGRLFFEFRRQLYHRKFGLWGEWIPDTTSRNARVKNVKRVSLLRKVPDQHSDRESFFEAERRRVRAGLPEPRLRQPEQPDHEWLGPRPSEVIQLGDYRKARLSGCEPLLRTDPPTDPR